MNIGYERAADPSRYGAVILAAGLSSRMKEFKPLLPVDGRPAIDGLAETLHSAGIRDIVVVTGHRREELEETIRRLGLIESFNADFERGMFSSIRSGLAKAGEAFPGKKAFFLMPVDCPLITIRVLRELMTAADAAEASAAGGLEAPAAENGGAPGEGSPSASGASAPNAGARFFVPTFEGKKGHPLLIPAEQIPEITGYDGPGGLKAITDRHWDGMVRVPVPDEEILLDMDTSEGYEEIRQFVASGFKREKLSVLSGRKRIILVRHGETRQHEEPMFIGQYDVELSQEGRDRAKELGAQLAELIKPDVRAAASWVEGVSVGKEPLPPIDTIYCSDLSRAEETAQIIAGEIEAYYENGGPDGADVAREVNIMNALSGFAVPEIDPAAMRIHVDVQPLQGLREMDLGDWDGRPVREIREQDPEGYERRGRNMFTYKTGNTAENFYDMQYRVVAALRNLLAEDYARNVIIVTHSGVIRALENNLKGLRVDDEWEPLDKGDFRVWTSPR